MKEQIVEAMRARDVERLKTLLAQVTELNLTGKKIGPASVQILAEALETNHTLTTLDVSKSQIGPASAHALAGRCRPITH